VTCETCPNPLPRQRRTGSARRRFCDECRALRARERRQAHRAAHPVSPEKRREYVTRYRALHPERVREQDRRRRFRDKYGMDADRYDEMLAAQSGRCAICAEPESVLGADGEPRPLCVDHSHKTGAVRGLLCARCNSALGLFGDSIDILIEAMDYLDRQERTG